MVKYTEFERKTLIRTAIINFYLANRARELPSDAILDGAFAAAFEDWAKIPDHELLPSIVLARQTPKLGPVTNRDVLVAWETVRASEIRKRRDGETSRLRLENRVEFSEDTEGLENIYEMFQEEIKKCLTKITDGEPKFKT